MNEILQKLNKVFNDKYNFLKIYEVIYDKNSNLCTFTFLFPLSQNDMTAEDRKNIEKFLKNQYSLNADVKVKFKKSFLDEILIEKEIFNFFNIEKKSLSPYLFKENISITNNENLIKIQIKLNKDILAMIDETELKKQLFDYLNEKFIADFDINIIENEDTISDVIEADDLLSVSKKKVERYKVEIIKKIVGGEIIPQPEYIKNNTKQKISVILAGIITAITKKSFKIKKGKKAGQEKSLYTFTLDDGKKIECVYFCSKANEKVMDSLEDGMMVVCVGDLNFGLNGTLTYYIRKMSWASKKSEIEEDNISEDTVTKLHKKVVPIEKIEIKTQTFLFDQKSEYNDTIKDKSVVVFDIETTGLDFENDEITEIGAVKIVNGIITEKFSTFVKPSQPIPLEVQNLTNITNEMVKDAPLISDVIIDFNDFCKDCILCGHNVIGFDFKFIKKAAESCGIYFKNQIIDTLVIARTSNLRLANYKLGTIVNALGLTLEGAHRAYNDAFATAQVLLELSKIKK